MARVVKVRKTDGTSLDPISSAKFAGLRYILDTAPGIRRERNGSGFKYIETSGALITNSDQLSRLKALAIPPAWKDVWICTSPQGHLQATGRDAKGRKQYKYHPLWREVRDSTKFHRMIAFVEALPVIRDRVQKDLEEPGLPKEKILATIVHLLELTLIRIGNEEYAKENNSYGLTTMRNHHLNVKGSKIRFQFKGKSGKSHSIGIKNKRLARILKKCQEIPGQELFQYIDENGNPVSIDSSDVNDYLRSITNQDFTAKDFRTWAGTIYTFMTLRNFDPYQSEADAKTQIKLTIETVAELLGNTPTICRKCYIHPQVLDGHLDRSLMKLESKSPERVPGLAEEEVLVLSYLRKQSRKTVSKIA
jgi:DNA topoisomerase I